MAKVQIIDFFFFSLLGMENITLQGMHNSEIIGDLVKYYPIHVILF